MSLTLRSVLAAAVALNLNSLAAAQVDANGYSSACPAPGGAHIIVARASTEPPGIGVIGVVAMAVNGSVPGSTIEPVIYPATLSDYQNSETAGVANMRSLINAFIANCPGTPLVTMGYSQGAQVTADSMVGQDVHSFPDNSTVDTALMVATLERTAAVIMMGDPSFVVGQPYNVGNATINGIFPREDNANFGITDLASRTKSYCDAGDPYCAAGNMISVHLGYTSEYGEEAAKFVIAQIAAFYANGPFTGNGTLGSNSTSTKSYSGASTGLAPSSTKKAASASASVTRPAATGTGSKPSGTAPSTATGTGAAKPPTYGSSTGAVKPTSAPTAGPTYAGSASTTATWGLAGLLAGVFAMML